MFSLQAALARANARLSDAVRAASSRARTDLAGLPPGAAALFAERLSHTGGKPVIVVTADVDSARRTAADLAFFCCADSEQEGTGEILVYPSADTTPYLAVAPDRRAAMDRLAVLFHLAQGLPWKFLVVPAPALLRRVPPRAAIASRSQVVRAESELDRDEFVRLLAEGGYLRVPVVEDPGTFAVRGAILDVFPPHARWPARIELDDWLVLSIKLFDPDDQRTVRDVREVFVHPVRDAIVGREELALARENVRAICDAANVPTTKTRALLDDIESGRAFFGIEGYLPAFYPSLDTLLDYVGPEASTVILDPTAVVSAVQDELGRARADLVARTEEGAPVFPLEAHYQSDAELAAAFAARRLAVVHTLAVGGAVDAETETSALHALETVRPDDVLQLGGEDQSALVAELGTQRQKQHHEDALRPVATRAREWLEAGLRVLITARTRTQAERIVSLLRAYEVAVAPKPVELAAEVLSGKPTGRAEIVIGPLGHGFVLAGEALACVTEEEIFGTRSRRRAQRKKSRADSTQPFLEDLRQLEPGDYVVHAEHGVGKYLGLERKVLGRSKLEEMRGVSAAAVEVLVVEYAGGDKLFVPVTRLGQIQKFGGPEGARPKIDRLGGQTFARTKAKVERAVRQLADELLRLYAQRAAIHREPLPPPDRSYAELEATFAFDETPDQSRAIDDVLGDLEQPRPMDRIVCGDVGFGKTEVALRAAFRVAMAGRQVALLCPTTVLAQQHFLTFRDRLVDWPLRIEVLSRFVEKKEQTEIVAALKEGKVDIVIGTHRLLSKDVHFAELGLLVVDEEQRFGVTHKERIKQLRSEVDVLTLSATPIPRTLQLAVGGLRDLSLITTAPVDRRAVRTFVSRWDDHVIKEALQRELARGGQAFFVYNRIEGLYERAQRLQDLLPSARIAVAHGQMNEQALERVMTDFVEGRFDVLCSTAIIESGLDIPRANTMVVDRADTFGLAQLYQLRGRVGRSKERAYCWLLTPPPSQMTDEARYRIEALEKFTELGSGFHVASLDMELRGAGDFLGAEQSGNVAAVGFDLFVHMLEEAVAHLRGEPVVHQVDPELTLDLEHFIPDDYIEDVGLRLSFYKRLSTARDDEAVADVAGEMEDRFGKAPSEAAQLVRAMRLKPLLRELHVLGCEATSERVTLHLREDTPLDPAKIMTVVARPHSPWKLTPDMKLTRRWAHEPTLDAIDRVEEMLRDLASMRRTVNESRVLS